MLLYDEFPHFVAVVVDFDLEGQGVFAGELFGDLDDQCICVSFPFQFFVTSEQGDFIDLVDHGQVAGQRFDSDLFFRDVHSDSIQVAVVSCESDIFWGIRRSLFFESSGFDFCGPFAVNDPGA